MIKHLGKNQQIHLFDSWEGLPEDWVVEKGHTKPAGCLATQVPVFNDDRVHIHKGWFEDTLPAWQNRPDYLSFVNVDCDLYSATVTTLNEIEAMLRPGSVVIFDELIGYEFWRQGEHKALVEWSEANGREFEYLARTRWMQAAITITK
jgi:hypothetical protein